jgi:hypothetical protein
MKRVPCDLDPKNSFPVGNPCHSLLIEPKEKKKAALLSGLRNMARFVRDFSLVRVDQLMLEPSLSISNDDQMKMVRKDLSSASVLMREAYVSQE